MGPSSCPPAPPPPLALAEPPVDELAVDALELTSEPPPPVPSCGGFMALQPRSRLRERRAAGERRWPGSRRRFFMVSRAEVMTSSNGSCLFGRDEDPTGVVAGVAVDSVPIVAV